MPIGEFQGVSYVIKARGDLTEREDRLIMAALYKFQLVDERLTELGYDRSVPETGRVWAQLTPDEYADVRGYEDVLIVTMLKSWDREAPLPDLDTVLDLPKPLRDAILIDASAEYTRQENFGADGYADPKADTGDSAG